MGLLQLLGIRKQQEQPSFMKHVPQQYDALARANTFETIDELTRDLETLEQHHSPKQCSDWFANILNITYPQHQLPLNTETVKLLSATVLPIFTHASENLSAQFTNLRKEIYAGLPEKGEQYGIKKAEMYFVQCPYQGALQIIPELEDVSTEDPQYFHARRHKDGMGLYPVIIQPDWINTFDRISLWGAIQGTTAWYAERFRNASSSGSLLQ